MSDSVAKETIPPLDSIHCGDRVHGILALLDDKCLRAILDQLEAEQVSVFTSPSKSEKDVMEARRMALTIRKIEKRMQTELARARKQLKANALPGD